MSSVAGNHAITLARRRALQQQMLQWYRQSRRDLPWRTDPPNPYYVLISETMLQQTQVATVISYFHRFIAAFPALVDLANASEQQVLALWQGLGYYRRARNLHAAARQIQNERGGVVPATVEQLMQLPGVGRYTAGAIASIAYGQQAPLVDGNVARVFARWFAIDQPLQDTATVKQMWSLAQQLVPADHPGDFNQGLMELGATICLPRQPRCDACPVARHCRAKCTHRESELPVPQVRRKPTPVAHQIVALEQDGRFYFEQRPGRGLWSHMWQMPTLEARAGRREIVRWLEELGIEAGSGLEKVMAFDHATTHRAIAFTLWRTCVSPDRSPPMTGQWRKLDDLRDLPLAKPQQLAVSWLRQR